MNAIKSQLDGVAFDAYEVQVSLAMNLQEGFPITSSLAVHVSPAISFFQEKWQEFLEAGDKVLKFDKLSFESVLYGGDLCETVFEDLELRNADRGTGFLTFFAKKAVQS